MVGRTYESESITRSGLWINNEFDREVCSLDGCSSQAHEEYLTDASRTLRMTGSQVVIMREDYALQPGTTSGKEVHTHMCSAHTHMCIVYVYTPVCSYVYTYVIICAYKGVCRWHVYVFSLLTLHISVCRFNHPGGKIIWEKKFSCPEHIDLFPCLYYLNIRGAAPTESNLPHLNSDS